MSINSTQCPVCLSDKSIRISDKLHVCRSCSIAFNSKFEPKHYDNGYFLSEYEKQYGKTYIEDYDAIYAISKKRLKKIEKYIQIKKNRAGLSLLDVGSAAGFFLKCARDLGFNNVTGVEISEFASSYCQREFHIPVIQESFDVLTFQNRFDIISAWFFIEHCEDPKRTIFKIFDSLNPGGVFAFSGPSIFGPLFKFNRNVWIDTHPSDHRIDFSPRFVNAMLKECGFKKIFIKPAGIHPERIISGGSALLKPFSIIYKIFSRATAFSDTIEVYAIK
jgi:2-polyprenyl-3-methyl-5-hydroxy-6-metoxy-1,4-benzoquinol methylase